MVAEIHRPGELESQLDGRKIGSLEPWTRSGNAMVSRRFPWVFKFLKRIGRSAPFYHFTFAEKRNSLMPRFGRYHGIFEVNSSSSTLLRAGFFMRKSGNWISKLTIGFFIPVAMLGAGIGLVMALGKAEPEQVSRGANDEASKMARLPIVEVGAAQAFDGESQLDIDLNGVVVPFREVTVAAEVAGRISEKSELCEPGRFVQKGDWLFKIDPRDYQLEVDRLARLRDQEYAQLREWEQEVANAQRSLELADEDLKLQENEIKRLMSLPAGVASESELDQARRARVASANQRQLTENQLDLLNARKRRLELSQQLATTQLDQAKLNLARTEIKAPISGVIISENAETDSYLQKGATLCTIEDTEKVEVRCSLRMDQLVTILDQSATSDSPGLPRQAKGYELPKTPVSIVYRVAGRDDLVFEWEGHLSRYDGIGLDPQSRTVPCRVTVEDPTKFKVAGKPSESIPGTSSALVRGMFVEVKIHTKPTRSLMMIPKLSLRPGNVLWRFHEDRTVLDELVVDASSPSASDTKKKESTVNAIDPTQWDVGRIEIIKGLHPVRMVDLPDSKTGKTTSYWIVETRSDIQIGDRFINTPLANVQGNGTDRVRTRHVVPPSESSGPNASHSRSEGNRS